MVASVILGAIALLGAGFYTSSLVASLAEPVALILAGASGAMVFVQMIRNGYVSQFFSSEEGEYLGVGLIGAAVFYLVFVVSQVLIVVLSPLAGLLVIGIGLFMFLFGPGVLFDLFEAIQGGE